MGAYARKTIANAGISDWYSTGTLKRPNDSASAIETRQRIDNFGGAGRDRTGDLIVANDALSQLSYSPLYGMG
jgi:hypothetical protein